MEFGILVFESGEHANLFMKASRRLEVEGIESERLAPNVLLVTRTQFVSLEDWGKFRSAGFQQVCGSWISNWHEEKELRDQFIVNSRESDLPFIEAFWGDNACVIGQET